jgi:hypothetical protein
MKLFLKVILLSTAVSLSISSCKKKKEDPAPVEEPTPTPTPTPTGINTIAEVFTVQGAPVETFTVAAGVAQTLTIPNSNGLKVEIPANAFVMASNGSTISGVIDLSVRAIMDKEEVMLSGAGANSTGAKLISTRGCVKITASQSSQTLRLVPGGGGVVLAVPDGTSTPAAMQKFYVPKVTATDSTKMWALGTDAATITTGFDSNLGKFTQRANLDSLKWLNVGAQWDSVAPKVSVTATVNATNFSKTNTVVYLSLNGSLTVGALFEVSPGVFRLNNMVAGKGANIVAISVINGQYYWARVPVLVSATTISLDLQPVSISTIRTNIQALP